MFYLHLRQRIPILALAGILAAALPTLAQTTTESILYSFPNANVVITDSFLQASDGNFYATSANGIYRFIPTRPGFSAPHSPSSPSMPPHKAPPIPASTSA